MNYNLNVCFSLTSSHFCVRLFVCFNFFWPHELTSGFPPLYRRFDDVYHKSEILQRTFNEKYEVWMRVFHMLSSRQHEVDKKCLWWRESSRAIIVLCRMNLNENFSFISIKAINISRRQIMMHRLMLSKACLSVN